METKANETHRVLRFSLWSDGRTTLGQPVTTTTYKELMDEFCHADLLGFYGVWVSEHHGFDDGYLPAPFTFLAHIAARAEHLHLGTNLLLLPLWPVRLIAEETAVLDVLSEGRFTLGVGLGYVQHEFAAFGVPRSQRKKRMEEAIPYLRAAFRGEHVPDGYNGAPLPVTPQPAQGARLPIYMGANTEVALDRVARLADGFLASGFLSDAPEQEVVNQWHILQSHLKKYGRDSTSFPIVLSTHLWVSDDPERDWVTLLAPSMAYRQYVYAKMGTDVGKAMPAEPDPKSFKREHFLVDTPDNVVKRLQDLQAQVPFSELCFWSHPPGVPHQAVVENLERIARHVLPAFK
ncbi:LLM class flavin-dependent oxidoreductase [Ktedonobacter racemifer]|uniref:Luciferase-like, subgroup n=1 Tax=Ktedonobacter racemifer DSM 44963 TaxID=485913 RepID=D6U7J4_KTERA|nr:LLM class flavin-dependent oxidoreductase [Ktedonobacter racemifer]EFH79855.1 Luciferase-like, subgroup [Ktedonobacter racemifer DSM 44963]